MHATSGDEIYSSEGEEGGDKEKAVLETEFDTARRLNIERNNQMLKSLGLDQSPCTSLSIPLIFPLPVSNGLSLHLQHSIPCHATTLPQTLVISIIEVKGEGTCRRNE